MRTRWHSSRVSLARALAAAWWLLGGFASAHGLLLNAEFDGRDIAGTAYYTNGERAAHEAVALVDLSRPHAEPRASSSDARGNFRFPATVGQRYRVTVYGEEGHSVEIELAALERARPTLIEHAVANEEGGFAAPAWAVIGGALLLSLIPAGWARHRTRSAAQSGAGNPDSRRVARPRCRS
jgi:hypothetical protein